jgi:hypothetical protein
MTCEEEFFTRINDNCLSKVIFGDDSASKHKRYNGNPIIEWKEEGY